MRGKRRLSVSFALLGGKPRRAALSPRASAQNPRLPALEAPSSALRARSPALRARSSAPEPREAPRFYRHAPRSNRERPRLKRDAPRSGAASRGFGERTRFSGARDREPLPALREMTCNPRTPRRPYPRGGPFWCHTLDRSASCNLRTGLPRGDGCAARNRDRSASRGVPRR